MEGVQRLLERTHRVHRVDAERAQPVVQQLEVPELRGRHRGELGLVVDGWRQLRILGQPFEGTELAIGQHAHQVNRGRSVGGIVERRLLGHVRTLSARQPAIPVHSELFRR
jgi:hypothetical protein